MTLTKCPTCGHTVLSVASHCPACSRALTSTFLGLEHQGELAECRSCGRPVRSRTVVCPHCGIPSPARQRLNLQFLLIPVAAALLGLMAIALRDRAFRPARADSTVAAVTSTAPQVVVAPAVVAAPPSVPAESAGAESLAAVAVGVADSMAEAGLQRRWTADWSNMRRAPHNESPVVRVLAPGTEVHVAENKWGWWAILWKGDTVGYIAGALLRPRHP